MTSQVTAANKRHGTQPHCVFAIDDIVHRGIRCILAIVYPGEPSNRAMGQLSHFVLVNTYISTGLVTTLDKAPPTPTKSPSQTSLATSTPQTTPTSSVDAKDVTRQLRAALEENLQ